MEASLAHCCCAHFCNHPFSFGFFHAAIITHFHFFSSLLSCKSDWVLSLCTSVPAMCGIIPARGEDRHASSTTIHNYQFNKTKVLFQDISFLNIFQTHQWMSVGHSAFYSMQVVIYQSSIKFWLKQWLNMLPPSRVCGGGISLTLPKACSTATSYQPLHLKDQLCI